MPFNQKSPLGRNEALENKAAVEEKEAAPTKEEIVPEQQTPVEKQSDTTTSAQEGTVHASVDDSTAASPLDEARTLLRPAWDSVYEAIGSPKSIPSDPLFLVVPVFAIIGLFLGLSSSSGKPAKVPRRALLPPPRKKRTTPKLLKEHLRKRIHPSTKSKSKRIE